MEPVAELLRAPECESRLEEFLATRGFRGPTSHVSCSGKGSVPFHERVISEMEWQTDVKRCIHVHLTEADACQKSLQVASRSLQRVTMKPSMITNMVISPNIPANVVRSSRGVVIEGQSWGSVSRRPRVQEIAASV